jgi:ribulose-phosphate 3-epimerase
MTKLWIAPSILAADFARLGEEVRAVAEAGADLIHFDVMDNHYVPNLSIGPAVCASLKHYIDDNGLDIGIDAHLMIDPVEALIPRFAEAGARHISIHPDTCRDIDQTIRSIRSYGCGAGLVYNPGVALTGLKERIGSIDMVLLMSVEPGFGGQSFIRSVLPKISEARAIIQEAGATVRLQVDGGITLDNIGEIAAAGADTFVAGSSIFGSADYQFTIGEMRRRIGSAAAR